MIVQCFQSTSVLLLLKSASSFHFCQSHIEFAICYRTLGIINISCATTSPHNIPLCIPSSLISAYSYGSIYLGHFRYNPISVFLIISDASTFSIFTTFTTSHYLFLTPYVICFPNSGLDYCMSIGILPTPHFSFHIGPLILPQSHLQQHHVLIRTSCQLQCSLLSLIGTHHRMDIDIEVAKVT